MKILTTILCLILFVATVNCRKSTRLRGSCCSKDGCHGRNKIWTEDCVIKRCGYHPNPNQFYGKTEILKTLCRDARAPGVCFDHGQRVYGNGQGTCYCNIDGDRATALCYV